MKLRRAQIVAVLATIILVVGFVAVPGRARAQVNGVDTYSSTGSMLGIGTRSSSPESQAGLNILKTGDSALQSPSFLTGTLDALLEWLLNNTLLPIANWFLTLMGVILNAVMILTLNMSSLVNASGGVVDDTWSTIRDLSSIMIIFFLLYTSIEIIIQKTDSKVQHMIIMVVIAGVLLNFSLFFTKIAVDASDLVGLAFYRAIAPNGANIDFNKPNNNYYSDAFTSGGISNEFMAALKIQNAAYSPNSTTFSTSSKIQIQNTNPLAIMISGIGGAAMMIIAGLSFLAASILFAVRIGLLIILMAFSPVYFVGMIIPKVKEKLSNRWWDALVSQCLILPIYMLFVYVALRVITNPSFQGAINPPAGATGGTALFSIPLVGTIMEYIIGIILISLPLLAAMQYASVGKDWADAIVNKGKDWGKNVVGSVGRNTFGLAATAANESEFMRKMYANNPNATRLVSGTLGKIGSGYGKARKAAEKKNKETFENIGKVDRAKYAVGPAGDKAYEEAKKVAQIAQADYLANLRKNSVFSVVTGNTQTNKGSSYGIAGGKEGKNLSEKLERQKAEEVKKLSTEELRQYASSTDASGKFQPPPIPGAPGNKLDSQGELGQKIQQINRKLGILARKTEQDKKDETAEKQAQEILEKAERARREAAGDSSGGKKPGEQS